MNSIRIEKSKAVIGGGEEVLHPPLEPGSSNGFGRIKKTSSPTTFIHDLNIAYKYEVSLQNTFHRFITMEKSNHDSSSTRSDYTIHEDITYKQEIEGNDGTYGEPDANAVNIDGHYPFLSTFLKFK